MKATKVIQFEQTPRDGEGQGSLAGCSPWDQEELDTTCMNNKCHARMGRINDSNSKDLTEAD